MGFTKFCCRSIGVVNMNWFEIIKNQRAITDTVTHVKTKDEDVPEDDKGRCYQKLLAIKDNLLHMAMPENNEIFKDYAEDMQTTETGWVPERNKEEDEGDNIYYSTEDTGPIEEYSRRGKNYRTKDGEKLYRWVEDEDKKPPPRFKLESNIKKQVSSQEAKKVHWELEPYANLISLNAHAAVSDDFSEEEYCATLEKLQEFFNSGKGFVPMGSNTFTVDGREFRVRATNKYDESKRRREQTFTVTRIMPKKMKDSSGVVLTVKDAIIARFYYSLQWDGLEKRIRMTPRQRPRFVYWVWARRPYWWAKEIFDKIESVGGDIGKWWN
jgi:hypothetical protein